MGHLTWQSKSGLVQLHSAQPHSEAYQTIHHVGTTLGMGRCNLATCDLRPAKLPVDDPLKGQQVVFLIGSGISVMGTPVV
jgi:hypothetical protein